MVSGGCGWVAGRAGLWGALATWVWDQQLQPQVPRHPASTCDTDINALEWLQEQRVLLKNTNYTVKGSNPGSGAQWGIHLIGHFCNAIHVKLKKEKLYFFIFTLKTINTTCTFAPSFLCHLKIFPIVFSGCWQIFWSALKSHGYICTKQSTLTALNLYWSQTLAVRNELISFS